MERILLNSWLATTCVHVMECKSVNTLYKISHRWILLTTVMQSFVVFFHLSLTKFYLILIEQTVELSVIWAATNDVYVTSP